MKQLNCSNTSKHQNKNIYWFPNSRFKLDNITWLYKFCQKKHYYRNHIKNIYICHEKMAIEGKIMA